MRSTLLLSLASLTLAASALHAADFVWNGTNGTWNSNSSNTPWSGQAWTDGHTANFNNAASLTVTVDGTVRPNTIRFAGNGAFTLNSGIIDFGNTHGVLDGSTRSYGAGFLSINSNLVGNNGITIKTSVHDEASTSLFTLAGDNRGLTGGITIDNGHVTLDSAHALGDNTVTLTNGGGMGLFYGGLIVDNNIVLGSGGGSLRTWGSRIASFTGTITGTGDLAVGAKDSPNATIALANTVSTSGNLLIRNGNVRIASHAAFANASFASGGNILLGSNAILDLTSGTANLFNGASIGISTLDTGATGKLTSSSGILTINSVDSSGNITTGNLTTTSHKIGAIIADADAATPLKLVKNGSNSLTLSAANTYSGGTEILGGRLDIANAQALGSGDVVVRDGGKVHFTQAGTYQNNFVLNGKGVPESSGYYGAMQLDGSASNLINITGNVTIASDSRITQYNSGHYGMISGELLGSGNLEKTHSGVLILSGNNITYSGNITITGGTLQIGNNGNSGNLSSSTEVINNATLTLKRADSWTFANDISGTGALNHSGEGTVTLSGSNTYSGATTISSGTVAISNLGNTSSGGNLGTSGQINLHGGTLRYSGDSATTARTFNTNGGSNGGTLDIAKAGTSLSLAGTISSSGGKALTKTGAGTLILTGTGNNSSAAVVLDEGRLVLAKSSGSTVHAIEHSLTINNGTLRLEGSGNDQISSSAVVTVNGGVFDMNGKNEALGSLNGSNGVFTNTASGTTSTLMLGETNAGNTAFAGSLQDGSGVLALTKTGSGTIILSGDNTYSGNTAITGGTLQIGNGGSTGSLGNSSVTISNGATLAINRAETLVQSGVISGQGKLVKSGSGTLVLTKGNSFSGGTTVSEGTLALDFSANGAPGANILAENSAITLGHQSALTIKGGTSNNGRIQTFSSLSLTGDATVRIDKGTASRVDIHLGVLALNGFSLNFTGADTALNGGIASAGSANFLTSTIAGANDGATRLATALWNGSNWASTASDGSHTYVVQWQGAHTDVFSKNDTLLDNASSNVRVVNGTGTAGSLHLGLNTATTTINSLLISASDSSATISLAGTNNSLVLSSGDLALGQNAQSFTIGSTANEGSLTAGANGPARLRLTNASDAALLTVNSVIKNNADNAVSLDVNGIGTVVLTGTNTYTGSTTIGDNATLQISGNGSLGNGNYAGAIASAGTLQFSSAVAQKLTGAVAINGDLILDNDNLTLAGTSRSSAQAVSAVISGSGTLNTSGGGNILINGTESNTNTGGIRIDLTGSGYGAVNSGTFVYFGKTNGAVAIADNAVLEVSGIGNNSIIMLEDNQFGAGAVINFSSANGNYARTNLNGTNQTLAGINTGDLTTKGGGVIQNDGAYNESAGESTLTLNGSGNYLVHGHFHDVENNNTYTAYKLNLIKEGSGTQVIAGDSIYYSGTTDIREGTLEFANVASSSKLVSDTTVRTGATLKYSGNVSAGVLSNITLDGGELLASTTSQLVLQNNTISGSGTLLKNNTGSLAIRAAAIALDSNSLIDIQSGIAGNDWLTTDWSNNQAELRLAAGTTFDLRGVRTTVGALNGSGTIVNSANAGSAGILGNVLTIGAGNGSGTYSGDIVANIWNDSSNASFGNERFSVDIRKVGSGTQVFAGHHAGATITIDGGTFQLGNATGNGTTDAHSIVNNATFAVANDSAQTLSSAISGNGNFVKSGSGVLTLNNKNTYAGETRIEGDTLRLGSSSLSTDINTIMPFGDSITKGKIGGYRVFLHKLLNASGSDFKFVGEQTRDSGDIPADQWYHAGIGGDKMVNQLPGGSNNALFLARLAMQPDAVLLHFGINDIHEPSDQATLRARMTELLDTFIAESPDSTIFLATVVPAFWKEWTKAAVDGFNKTIIALVDERQTAGKNIVLVDMNSDFPKNGLRTDDNLHPNDTGYAWMAQQWYNALMENLGEQQTAALPSGTNVSIDAAATLDLDNHIAQIATLSGEGKVLLGSGTLIINSSDNASFAGNISGSGSLVKNGSGTQTLSGENTFSGDTLLNGGTLLVNGSLSGTVTVMHGATLGGNGRIKGNIAVAEGGTLSPGNSIDTLALEGNAELAAGAKLLIEIGDNGEHDIIAFLGTGSTFTFANGAELIVLNAGSSSDLSGEYQIFTGNVTVEGQMQFSDSAYTYTIDASGKLTVAAIPKPSTYSTMGVALLGGIALLHQRRRQTKAG